MLSEAALSDDMTPDFDAISRRLADRGYYSESGVNDIVAALRDVWNARGTADVRATNHRLATMAGPVISEGDFQQLRDAIKAVDR